MEKDGQRALEIKEVVRGVEKHHMQGGGAPIPAQLGAGCMLHPSTDSTF